MIVNADSGDLEHPSVATSCTLGPSREGGLRDGTQEATDEENSRDSAAKVGGWAVAPGDRAGVRVGFALSPGLSIRYSSAEDLEVFVDKLASFVDLGSRFLSLALDDVPFADQDLRNNATF